MNPTYNEIEAENQRLKYAIQNRTKTTEATELVPVNDSETSALLQVIERAALNPAVDIDKMERLLEMQKTVIAHRARMAFIQAMNKCQIEMAPISRDAVNPQTKSKYASYAQLDKHLRPIYTANGFTIITDTGDATKPEEIRILAEISHIEGHSKTIHIDLDNSGKGARGGDVMTKTHATASCVSYGKRYLLGMGFNIATEDRDGNDPDPVAVAVISEDQAMTIATLVKDTGTDMAKFLRHVGHKAAWHIQTVRDIPASHYDYAVEALEKKRLQEAAKAARQPGE